MSSTKDIAYVNVGALTGKEMDVVQYSFPFQYRATIDEIGHKFWNYLQCIKVSKCLFYDKTLKHYWDKNWSSNHKWRVTVSRQSETDVGPLKNIKDSCLHMYFELVCTPMTMYHCVIAAQDDDVEDDDAQFDMLCQDKEEEEGSDTIECQIDISDLLSNVKGDMKLPAIVVLSLNKEDAKTNKYTLLFLATLELSTLFSKQGKNVKNLVKRLEKCLFVDVASAIDHQEQFIADMKVHHLKLNIGIPTVDLVFG